MAKDIVTIDHDEYQQWLQHICEEIDWQRLKAVMQLNASTLQHYWWMGNDIIRKQKEQGWGAKVINKLSSDLQKRYGGDSGYSARNLGYVKSFAIEYPDFPFLQVELAKITVSADGEVCEVDCPTGALSIVPSVYIDKTKCIHCHRCLNSHDLGRISADCLSKNIKVSA